MSGDFCKKTKGDFCKKTKGYHNGQIFFQLQEWFLTYV